MYQSLEFTYSCCLADKLLFSLLYLSWKMSLSHLINARSASPSHNSHSPLFAKICKKKKLLEFRCKTSRLLCYLGLKMNKNCKSLAPKSWKTQKLKVERPSKTVFWIVFGFTDFHLRCIFLWWFNIEKVRNHLL